MVKIKQGFILREVAGSYIVVVVGERAKNFNAIIKLNETGALLWKGIESGLDEQGLIQKLLEEYDTDKDTAQNDVNRFIEKLKEAGLAE